MRMLLTGFIFWIFIVPSLVGSFLFLTVLATFVPPLYFALTWFVLAFSTALLLCGPSWVIPSRAVRPLSFRLFRNVVVTKQIHLRRKTMKRITSVKVFFE